MSQARPSETDPPANPTCPLCDFGGFHARQSIAFADIFSELQSRWRVQITEEVFARHQPGPVTTILECSHCHLEYFWPAVPGDTEFYDELMRNVPYALWKWEFGEVMRDLSTDSAVVDFGCGSGQFLDLIQPNVRRSVGVDHNGTALGPLAARGIETYCENFADFAGHAQGEFDVVCAFHIIEHLPNVADLVRSAVRCLKPKGRLYISVPNRSRWRQPSLEPLDCPPHHLSHWEAAQMEVLAQKFGLELASVRLSPPDLSAVAGWYEHLLCRALRLRSVGRFTQHLVGLAQRMTYRPFVDRGYWRQLGVQGATILAEFQPNSGSYGDNGCD